MIALIILCLFIVFTMIGFPLVYVLGISTILYIFIENIPLSIVAQTAFTSLDNFSYVAVPLFIFVGNLMGTGGLSRRLIKFSTSILLKIPGSVGAITVLSCTFFGAISGSASATTVAIGGMMIPEMNRKNYKAGYSGTLSATAGTLGAMIPPSIVMIIYAVVVEVSVTDMFIAGFILVIFIAISLIVVNMVYALVKKIDISHSSEKLSLKNTVTSFWDVK